MIDRNNQYSQNKEMFNDILKKVKSRKKEDKKEVEIKYDESEIIGLDVFREQHLSIELAYIADDYFCLKDRLKHLKILLCAFSEEEIKNFLILTNQEEVFEIILRMKGQLND